MQRDNQGIEKDLHTAKCLWHFLFCCIVEISLFTKEVLSPSSFPRSVTRACPGHWKNSFVHCRCWFIVFIYIFYIIQEDICFLPVDVIPSLVCVPIFIHVQWLVCVLYKTFITKTLVIFVDWKPKESICILFVPRALFRPKTLVFQKKLKKYDLWRP